MPLQNDPRIVLARWARGGLEPGDEVVDCSGLQLGVVLLPWRGSVCDHPPRAKECVRLAARPAPVAGALWLITDTTVDTARLERAGWELEELAAAGAASSQPWAFLRWRLNRFASPPGSSTAPLDPASTRTPAP